MTNERDIQHGKDYSMTNERDIQHGKDCSMIQTKGIYNMGRIVL